MTKCDYLFDDYDDFTFPAQLTLPLNWYVICPKYGTSYTWFNIRPLIDYETIVVFQILQNPT
jgi:hypothetical protein